MQKQKPAYNGENRQQKKHFASAFKLPTIQSTGPSMLFENDDIPVKRQNHHHETVENKAFTIITGPIKTIIA